MKAGVSLSLFDAPPSSSNANLEQRINDAFQRVVTATDFESARIPSAEMSALIRQRTAVRVRQMEKERGIAR